MSEIIQFAFILWHVAIVN